MLDAATAEARAIMDERIASKIRWRGPSLRPSGMPACPRELSPDKRELRAAELERIGAAHAGQGEPRFSARQGEEMRHASAAVLGGAA